MMANKWYPFRLNRVNQLKQLKVNVFGGRLFDLQQQQQQQIVVDRQQLLLCQQITSIAHCLALLSQTRTTTTTTNNAHKTDNRIAHCRVIR